ncbi:hypothetical protein HDU76_005073 [Blyttiomyces sp. JEL0837]|nr:hypothetical protein HDU76_005073 [Blyttiomyces sp. JEL0837]
MQYQKQQERYQQYFDPYQPAQHHLKRDQGPLHPTSSSIHYTVPNQRDGSISEMETINVELGHGPPLSARRKNTITTVHSQPVEDPDVVMIHAPSKLNEFQYTGTKQTIQQAINQQQNLPTTRPSYYQDPRNCEALDTMIVQGWSKLYQLRLRMCQLQDMIYQWRLNPESCSSEAFAKGKRELEKVMGDVRCVVSELEQVKEMRNSFEGNIRVGGAGGDGMRTFLC